MLLMDSSSASSTANPQTTIVTNAHLNPVAVAASPLRPLPSGPGGAALHQLLATAYPLPATFFAGERARAARKLVATWLRFHVRRRMRLRRAAAFLPKVATRWPRVRAAAATVCGDGAACGEETRGHPYVRREAVDKAVFHVEN
ncbi:hypothetical protein L596_030297 [Steinernema carpocapsae]|uniref:Uncharacterized protein n=1 Tax=Steinernema carpocapsae TaxID=34508 RepID=A0A4U5LNY9_STECR|nr:hypothetical protein L596_030297 [Steinernema carpocapsae]